MDPERWGRIDALFHRAVPLGPAERAALLAAECREDAALLEEVERLLAADARQHELVDRFEEGALHPPDDPLVGRVLGAYRLTGRIAVGGMGVVYRAERTDGLFAHDVAVKLIRGELASENLIRRFEFERATLARLHHPNIAQLHDGGATADGRPYLVMELVRGLPIDRFCDERLLSIDQRLRLFVEVCRAVHFAHQNLVVHRDLKPANILIDQSGVPKLLDFGIARLVDESRREPEPEATRTGRQILTPEYASPEQITGGAVTTAMDVYSLGVVLYELLTGHRPFQTESHSPVEWHRAISEKTPTRPSSLVTWPEAAVSADTPHGAPPELLAERRGCSPRTLRRRLRGDLDRVVLMALRKEPERRYASAKDMADDVERHFSGHPLLARGDSVAYRARKFAARNRLAVGSAAAVLAALVLGIVLARRGELRARAQAEHARIEAESFQGIAEFLMDTFLASAPGTDDGQLAQERQRIQMHAARLRREYGDQDHLRANLLDSLGHVAQRLGLDDDAETLVREALSIREQAFGRQSLEYALSLRSLGQLRYAHGELEPAAGLFADALALHRACPRETHTDVASVANDLATCLRGLGRVDEAEALHREALALRRGDGEETLAVAESLNNLAGIDLDRNDPGAALKSLDEALAIRRRILGSEDLLTLQSVSNLATASWRVGEKEHAYALLDEAQQGSRALHRDGEEQLAQVLSNRGGMLMADHEYEAAEPLLEEALAIQTRRFGPRNPALATTLSRLARLQEALKRPAEARASWERALEIRRESGASPRYLSQALYDYGAFLAASQAPGEAGAAFQEAIEVMHRGGLSQIPLMARAELAYGETLLACGDPAAAKVELDQAFSILTAAPAGHEDELGRARAALQRCNAGKDD